MPFPSDQPVKISFDAPFPDFSPPEETPSHGVAWHSVGMPEDPDAEAIAFRHSGWAGNRARVRAALVNCEVPTARLARFDACGSCAWVLRDRDNPEHVRLASSHCHDRFCVPCAAARSARVARNLTEAIHGRVCRFVTLTLRTSGEPLAESIDRLYRSFAKLRRAKCWSSCVTAGVACLEVKWRSETSRWHPHLHCIVIGRYLPQRALSAAWLKASGDSYVVDVRYVRSASACGAYVCKYASKPLDGTFLAIPARLEEAIKALRGRRTILAYGDWSHLNLMAVSDAPDWEPVAPLWRVLAAARAGDPEAVALLAALRGDPPCPTVPPLISGFE